MIIPVVAIAAVILYGPSTAFASKAQAFVAPAPCPSCESVNYVGPSNATIPTKPVVSGRVFNRFIQIWLENTDFNVAASTSTFKKLAKQGITLSSYLALTHPSEPNYVASISGDFWGMADDNYYYVPSNISTIVDLLEAKDISWATYQENMPHIAYATDYTQNNYVNPSSGDYTYFCRKHSPLSIHAAVANSTRAANIRNFNDFARDVNASALPQWLFVTPNLVNDAHDTTIDFTSQWLEYWLVPLLADPAFNPGNGTDGTLIVLTFDENSNYLTRNNVFTLLLGSAVPPSLYGTTDDTLYSHYSTLSTVEGNWNLGNLGRGDVNATLGNVFNFVADAINFTNTQTPRSEEPDTRWTDIYPGPLRAASWIPFTAPTNSTRFGPTFVRPGLDWSLTRDKIGPPIKLAYSDIPNAGTGDFTYDPPLYGST